MTPPKLDLAKWKPIKGYENLYEISNIGLVKALGNGDPRGSKKRILKPALSSTGYLTVSLSMNGKVHRIAVHRLIAKAFIGNPRNLPEINHINSVKTDNRIENLEWCTSRQNRSHYTKTLDTSSKHTGVHWHKLNKRWVATIRIDGKRRHLGNFENEQAAAEAYRWALAARKGDATGE